MRKPSDALLILTPEERDAALSFIQRRLRTSEGEQAPLVRDLGNSARQQIRRLQAARARFQAAESKPAQVMLKIYDSALIGLAGLVAECSRASGDAATTAVKPDGVPSTPKAPDDRSGIEDESAEELADFLLIATPDEERNAESYIEERVECLSQERLGSFRDACRELLEWWESERGQAAGLVFEQYGSSRSESGRLAIRLKRESLRLEALNPLKRFYQEVKMRHQRSARNQRKPKRA